jgi:ribosomal protein L11 methylase PrmA
VDKHALVARFLATVRPGLVFDLGANTGEYSRIARDAGARVIALDGDPVAVERGFERLSAEKDERILPLWMDLTNPSPSQGWGHREWPSFEGRGPADVVMALALVHHLAIGNNVPLAGVSSFLARLGKHLIIEWVPKEDPQVQRLLSSRRDVFADYTEAGLLRAIEADFDVVLREPIPGSTRVLFLLRRAAPSTA